MLRHAVALHQSGRTEQAEPLYRQVLQLQPGNANAMHLLGVCRRQRGDQAQAVRLIREALAINPRLPGAWNNLGVACSALGRWNEAVAAFDEALARAPATAEIHYNRAMALESLERFEAALADYDRALAIRPDHATALNNRGNLLQRLNRHEEALASYDRALAIRPDYAAAYNNRGTALQELNRLDQAMADYDRAIALEPGYGDALLSRSLCALLLGRHGEGWRGYEARWQTSDRRAGQRQFASPLWLGEADIGGRSLLVHAEQGFGDTLQFCRYLPELAARGITVILEVQPELRRLLDGVAGASRVLARGDELPGFDYHCPLLSLPLASGHPERIPAAVPYLRPDPERSAGWNARLGPGAGRLRVGLVWAGSPRHKNDHNRSLPLALLAEHLADLPVDFHSLQKAPPAADGASLAGASWLRQWTEELADFADTAGLVSELDLVISVDTSVAHLAGALGRPLWLMLPFAPDWRWQLHRQDSPWYPTARLFRQPAGGDWRTVLHRVREALGGLLAAGSAADR